MGLRNFKLTFCLVLFFTLGIDDTNSQSRRSRYKRFRSSTTQRPPPDDTGVQAFFYTRLAIVGLGVTVFAVFIVIALCIKCKTNRRRTMPVVIPVRPADAHPQPQPVRQAPVTNRLSAPSNQQPDIFTVTPVLPSYADVTKNTEANRPPPAYSVRMPNLGTDYALSVSSPSPPYAPREPHNGESRGTSGRRNVQYSRTSSSVDFVLG